MTGSRPTLAFVLMLATQALSACACEESPASCGTTFEWTASSADGELAPGHYTFTVTLDDTDVYQLNCQIQATVADSDCDATMHLEGEAEYAVGVTVLDDDASAMVFLHASRPADGSNGASGSDRAAPGSVVIAVELDATPLAMVEYVLDDAKPSDHRCGQCDGPQRYSHVFD